MSEYTFVLNGEDGKKIFVYSWLPVKSKPLKGIIQVVHGMAEHAERYREFAEYLNSEGFGVYANDHRGHGKTAETLEDIGYFADNSGWALVISDMFKVTEHIRKEHPSTPIFLLGQSMGSFLSREYITLYGDRLTGVILSGTIGNPGVLGNFAILIAKLSCKFKGKRTANKLLNNLSFGSYNNSFKPVRTKFDWLSRDEKVVDKYIEDEFCGGVVSSGFYVDMLQGIKEINKKENVEKIPKNLPVFFLSGEKDPLGENTKGVSYAIKLFERSGIKDITFKFYRDGRHEMLNEINKTEVYSDIVDWINIKSDN